MDTAIYNIDSRFRDKTKYPSPSSFNYSLKSMGNFNLKNITEIKISSIEFPNTSYQFSTAKGNLSYQVDSSTFSINEGNYNTTELIDELNANTHSDLTFSLDSNTGKITITSASFLTIDFTSSSSYGSLGYFIGFSENTYSFTGDLEAENLPNVIGESYYFLRVNDFGHILNNNKRYMSKIVVTAPLFEHSFDSRKRYVSKTYKFKQPVNLDKLEIRLEDYNGNLVDSNGINFSFTAELISIKNKLLKEYSELTFFSNELLEILLFDNMLEFYKRRNDEEKKKKDNFFKTNNVANPVLNQMNETYTGQLNMNNQLRLDDDKFKFNY